MSRQRIARLMGKMGIASRIRKKWVKTTQSNHRWPVAPNLLGRNFSPENLSQVWVSDITYIRGGAGWLYLTTVMDLGDRQILGWSLSKGMSAEQTTVAAPEQASPNDGLEKTCYSTPIMGCNTPVTSLPGNSANTGSPKT